MVNKGLLTTAVLSNFFGDKSEKIPLVMIFAIKIKLKFPLLNLLIALLKKLPKYTFHTIVRTCLICL